MENVEIFIVLPSNTNFLISQMGQPTQPPFGYLFIHSESFLLFNLILIFQFHIIPYSSFPWEINNTKW